MKRGERVSVVWTSYVGKMECAGVWSVGRTVAAEEDQIIGSRMAVWWMDRGGERGSVVWGVSKGGD